MFPVPAFVQVLPVPAVSAPSSGTTRSVPTSYHTRRGSVTVDRMQVRYSGLAWALAAGGAWQLCTTGRRRQRQRWIIGRCAGTVEFANGLAGYKSNFIGKAPPFRLAFACHSIPHPDKVKKGGEDSFFACSDSQSFGVADGVGGWARDGIDPGKFSRNVLQYAYEGIRKTPAGSSADLKEALGGAVSRIISDGTQGGTTVLLGQLSGSTLTVMNFGDSGVIVLRPALRTKPNQPGGGNRPFFAPRTVLRSTDQTHFFNCPYQVSSQGRESMEPPDVIQLFVEAGDLIIAGTDGVFDNLFDGQIRQIAAAVLSQAWVEGSQDIQPGLELLAQELAKAANAVGGNGQGETPFMVSAKEEGLDFQGGKLDDTTVVVAMVVPQNSGAAATKPAEAVVGERLKMPQFHNFEQV